MSKSTKKIKGVSAFTVLSNGEPVHKLFYTMEDAEKGLHLFEEEIISISEEYHDIDDDYSCFTPPGSKKKNWNITILDDEEEFEEALLDYEFVNSQPVVAICPDGSIKHYKTCEHAATDLNLNYIKIWLCCNNNIKSLNKYIFMYKKNYTKLHKNK